MTINLKPFYLCLFVSVVVLALANVVATNLLATGGYELDQYAAEAARLEKDNLRLSSEIAGLQSLSSVETRAHDLGFVSITKTLSIAGAAPVAFVGR